MRFQVMSIWGLTLAISCAAVLAQTAPQLLWNRYYDRPYGEASQLVVQGIAECPDGGIVLAGYFGDGSHTSVSPILKKLDGNGNEVWTRTFFGPGMFYAVHQTSDGHMVACGYGLLGPYAGGRVLKFDRDGNTIWDTNLSDVNLLNFVSVRETRDGGFVTIGTNRADGNTINEFFVIRLGVDGDTVWVRSFDDGPFSHCEPKDIAVDDTNGFLVIARVDSGRLSVERRHTIILRLDDDGNELWRQVTSSEGGWSVSMSTICHAPDSGYMIMGYAESTESWEQLLLRISTAGDTLSLLRTQDYGIGSGSSVVPSRNGGYLWVSVRFLSFTQSAVLTRRIDNEGRLIWTQSFYTPFDDYSGGPGVVTEACDGGWIVEHGEWSGNSPNGPRALLLRYGPDIALRDCDFQPLAYHIALDQNYPNPFNESTRISVWLTQPGRVVLDVYDILGRRVDTLVDGDLPVGQSTFLFQGRDLPSGVYLYRLSTNGTTQTRKMMLLK